MKVLVLGLGTNGGGRAAAEYFASKKNTEVRISDMADEAKFGELPNLLREKGIECFFSDKDLKCNVKWADVVIKNPAVPQTLPELSLAKSIRNDFYYLFTSKLAKSVKLICVTGTKGKTTTVAAITHALNTLGHEAMYCGNIGVSAFIILEELEKREKEGKKLPEYIVAELSSWQINDTYIALNGRMPEMKVACFTSLYPDHQNSYHSMEKYFFDKIKLFGPKCEHIIIKDSIKDIFFKNTHKLEKRTTLFPSAFSPYKSANTELQCAYAALRELCFKKKDIVSALSSYKGMPHRAEQVAIIDNVMYINDSAATIGEAVQYSFDNLMPLSVNLITGGTDKELSAEGMRKALNDSTSIILLDGSFTRSKLIPMLDEMKKQYSGPYRTMEEAFSTAEWLTREKLAETGRMQVLLLSPGSASFELFKNEFERGDKFREEVLKRKNKA